MARAVPTVASALALVALCGCARPQVFGLRHDRAFTYQSLDSGSIAVGGVTWIGREAELSPTTRGQFESLLTNSLRDAYPRTDVPSAGAVAAEFGDSVHGEVLNRYRRTGELDSRSEERRVGKECRL